VPLLVEHNLKLNIMINEKAKGKNIQDYVILQCPFVIIAKVNDMLLIHVLTSVSSDHDTYIYQ